MEGKKWLFALRHGERVDRVARYRQPPGYIPHDPPITDLGQIQASRSGLLIKSFSPEHTSYHVASSPFLRCLQTAAAVAKLLGVPVHVEEGFGEWLATYDFAESPMDALCYKQTGTDLGGLLGVPLIINESLARASYPESLPVCKSRARSVLQGYLPKVQEQVLVIVSHLHLVDAITEEWSGHACNSAEENYCLISHAEMEMGKFNMVLETDHTHAPQFLSR